MFLTRRKCRRELTRTERDMTTIPITLVWTGNGGADAGRSGACISKTILRSAQLELTETAPAPRHSHRLYTDVPFVNSLWLMMVHLESRVTHLIGADAAT